MKGGLYFCVPLLQTDHKYYAGLQTRISTIIGVRILMFTRKCCMKCCSCVFLDYLILKIQSRKISAKAKRSPLTVGNVAPKEKNPLYSV